MLPRDVFCVRHGYSLANYLHHLAETGALDEEQRQLRVEMPDHHFPLMRKGRQQGVAAGRWLGNEAGLKGRNPTVYCSEHARALETAGIIGREIELARPLLITPRLGERDWGRFPSLTAEEQALEYELRKRNPRHWKPLNGESLRDLNEPVRGILESLHRQPEEIPVVLVSHGEFLTALSEQIEYWLEDRLIQAIDEGMPNCGVVHYSRVNPANSSDVHTAMRWVRRVCPWNKRWKDGNWCGEWTEIRRPKFTWSDALEHVHRRYPLPARYEEESAT